MSETRTINCYSCGAGHPAPAKSWFKCEYCDNHNEILDGGRTKIITKNFKEEERKIQMPMSLIVLFMILMPVFGWRFIRIMNSKSEQLSQKTLNI